MKFRAGFVAAGTVSQPLPLATELLSPLQTAPEWEALSIEPESGEFPRALVTFHLRHGFVVQCYEAPASWSDFLTQSPRFSEPTVRVDLGGQALEHWPEELFVPQALAAEAVAYFLQTGTQDPALHWVRIDRFPRVTLDRTGL